MMRLICLIGLILGSLVSLFAQSHTLEAHLFEPDILDAYTAAEVSTEWEWLEEPEWEAALTPEPTGYVTLTAGKKDQIKVFLDGEYVGCLCDAEPLVLSGEPGPYTLELRLPNGKKWHQQVTILSTTPKQYTLLAP